MFTINLYNLNYEERESLYMDLEHRYIDYTWVSQLGYNNKYKKFIFELVGYKNER